MTTAHLNAIRWKLGFLDDGNNDDHRRHWAGIASNPHFDRIVDLISDHMSKPLKEAIKGKLSGKAPAEWLQGLSDEFSKWVNDKPLSRMPKIAALLEEIIETRSNTARAANIPAKATAVPAWKPPAKDRGTGLYGEPGNPAGGTKPQPTAPVVTTPVAAHPPAIPARDTATTSSEPPVTQPQTPPVSPPPTAKWQYKPVASELEKRDDSECHPLPDAPAGWNAFGARVRGRKHKLDGTNCDDSFAFRQVGQWTIVAVSDGAGSKKFSRVGSQVATAAAVESLASFCDGHLILLTTSEQWKAFGFHSPDAADLGDALIKAAKAAREAIGKASIQWASSDELTSQLGRPADDQDFSCTLLLTAVCEVTVDGQPRHLVAAVQVGDGMIGAIDRSGAAHILGVADSGGHAGETEFITSTGKASDAFLQSKIQLELLDLQSLLVMTDGVADDYFPGPAELPRLWGDLLVNGIPEFDTDPNAPVEDLPEGLGLEVETIEEYPQKVTLHSSEAIAKHFCVSIADLLKRPNIVSLRRPIPGKSAAERLQLWIDAYQVRGSFDDRALVVFHRRNFA